MRVDLWVGGEQILDVQVLPDIFEDTDGAEIGGYLMRWAASVDREGLAMESHVIDDDGNIMRAVVNHADTLDADYPVEIFEGAES